MIHLPELVCVISLVSHGVMSAWGAGLEFMVAESKLPSSRRKHSVLYDGQDTIYIIGGFKDWEDSDDSKVLRYSLESGLVDTVGHFLNISRGAALMNGDDIIYFGGWLGDEGAYSSAVYSYSTVDQSFEIVAQLPRAMDTFTVAWNPTEQVAYLFGGCDGPERGRVCYEDIHKYNASTHEIEASIARLPSPRYISPAVWDFTMDTGLIYVFGEHVNQDAWADVVQFNTSNNEVLILPTRLPLEEYYVFGVHADIDQQIYIVEYKNLLRFNPVDRRSHIVKVNAWPYFIRCAEGVYVPKLRRIYIVGGSGALTSTEYDRSFNEIFFVQLDGSLPTDRTPAEDVTAATPRKDSRTLIYTLSVGIPSLTMLVAGAVFVYRRRRNSSSKQGRINQHSASMGLDEIREFEEGIPQPHLTSVQEDKYISRRNVIHHKYDRLFELAEDKVTVDWSRVLGGGEFGLVLKGTLKEVGKPVAVKTLKPQCSDKYHLKALLSEIKILIYVGRHPHIANLIGAQTGQLNRGRAFLFVEYCPLGDVEEYLEKHKEQFFNCVAVKNVEGRLPALPCHYVHLPNIHICVCSLHSWSFQIASAMEFLTVRNVVHGDVAARNVLLADKHCAKLTDFGLAKQLRSTTYWSSGTHVPWRNAAIESLCQMSFSIQSDVWSFGVTLWEVFSLSETPYKEFKNHSYDFVDRLKAGLRLPPPLHASAPLYAELVKCWALRPDERPAFADLKETLQLMDIQCRARHSSLGSP